MVVNRVDDVVLLSVRRDDHGGDAETVSLEAVIRGKACGRNWCDEVGCQSCRGRYVIVVPAMLITECSS